MVTTHAMVGVAVAAAVATVVPEHAAWVGVAGLVGGAAPDLDLLLGRHRKTLHFPVLGPVVATPVVAGAAIRPGPVTVAVAVAAVAAAVHGASDVLGAGEELEPWERTTTDAVYSHVHGRWLRARYWVRYDGAPEDVLLTAVFAAPGALVFAGWLRWICVACVVLAVAYGAVRKRLPPYFEHVVG